MSADGWGRAPPPTATAMTGKCAPTNEGLWTHKYSFCSRSVNQQPVNMSSVPPSYMPTLVSASFKVWPARPCANWKRDSLCMKPFVRWCSIWQTVNIAAIGSIHNVRLRKKNCWGELAKQCFHCNWSGIQAWMDSFEFVSSIVMESFTMQQHLVLKVCSSPPPSSNLAIWVQILLSLCQWNFWNKTDCSLCFLHAFLSFSGLFSFAFIWLCFSVIALIKAFVSKPNLVTVLVCVKNLKTLLLAPIASKLNQNVFHHRDKNNWSLSEHADACINPDKMKTFWHCGWLNLANVWNNSHVWCIVWGQNLMQNAFIHIAKQLRPTTIGWHHFPFLSILFWPDQWSLSSLLFLHGCENEAALVHVDITSLCGVNRLAACSCSLDICNPVCRRAEQRLLPDGHDALH